jgi:hypothetical protein
LSRAAINHPSVDHEMTNRFPASRFSFSAAIGLAMILAAENSASAAELLAQTGTAKTAVGWAIVLLCIGLGLLVVCRPSGRKSPNQLKR